jgi:hypothetical protein
MFVMFTDELYQGFETCNTLYRAVVWTGKVGITCTVDSARMLHYKYLCSRHFSESDFTTAERVRLKRVAVPCGSDSVAQLLPKPDP